MPVKTDSFPDSFSPCFAKSGPIATFVPNWQHMFGKLAEAKQKAEEIKQRLEQVSVMGQSPDGMFRVIVSGNRRVLDIQSAEENWNRPDAKSSLLHAINAGIEQADKVAEAEMAAVAKDLLPGGLGGLAGMFKK